MVALPGQLFYSPQIPACFWFLARDRKNRKLRDRRGEGLLIDARSLGTMLERRHRELTAVGIQEIAGTYHTWRGEPDVGDYEGICKSATLNEIRQQGHVLTPGHYVGPTEVESRILATLLPELISGELRVANAERFVGRRA